MGQGKRVVWLEGRSGKGVLVVGDGKQAARDLTSVASVRAEVGYGGGDYCVHGGWIYYVEQGTGRLFRQEVEGGAAQAITPQFGNAAAPVVSPDGRWVAYVHSYEDVDRIAVVDAQGNGWPMVVAEGHDFYMQPTWNADGGRLAWVAWDHPNMPWDGTLLEACEVQVINDRWVQCSTPVVLAGGPEVAVFQPEFSPTGDSIFYVSDETGWGRLAVQSLADGTRRWLTPPGVEHAAPAWAQGQATYAVGSDGTFLIAAQNKAAFVQLVRVDVAKASSEVLPAVADYTDITALSLSETDRLVFVGSSPLIPPRVVMCDLSTNEVHILARASTETLPAASLATCEAMTWKVQGEETSHGLYFAPVNPRFTSSGLPPLVLLIHGGPTSQVKAGWRPDAQFFTSRGYAVLFVNYRGGTGYGRDYMLKLRGNWGNCDVEDAIAGADFLAEQGKVDRRKCVIMGGSAGGFTVLHALTQQPEAFAAGISLFGVANQFHLAAQTHKFESRYLDTILGPLPAAAEIYRARSPEFHADRIIRPLAIYQGDIARVVPRAQSDVIAAALARRNSPHVYHVYEGEGHGWRKRETIEHYYQSVDDFLRQYVVFQ